MNAKKLTKSEQRIKEARDLGYQRGRFDCYITPPADWTRAMRAAYDRAFQAGKLNPSRC